MAREWTGSVSKLPESMRAFAVEMANLASEEAAELKSDERCDVDAALSRVLNFLRDHAYTLSEWGDAVDELYARLDHELPNGLTVAQGVALVRFMGRENAMAVFRGGQGLERDKLLVELEPFRARAAGRTPYTGGIDRDGSTST